MSKIMIFVVSLFACFFFSQALADNVHCPPTDLLKSIMLVQAIQSPYDPDSWNFRSQHFYQNGLYWFLEFGSLFPGIKNAEMALEKGNRYFQNAAIIIKNPKVINIPGNLLCNYTPEGRLYWISVLSKY